MACYAPSLGGFDCEFVEPPPDDLICLICTFVAKDPQQLTCCGRLYCKKCLKELLKKTRGKCCPQCRASNWRKFPDKKSSRNILGLRVKCKNSDAGCKWEGELKDEDKHSRECEHRLVQCKNKCKDKRGRIRKFPLSQESSHLATECPFRRVKCEMCGVEYQLGWNHIYRCPQQMVTCDNEGCDKRVKRCDLRKHYKICDYKLINCEHADRGCRVILPRVAMPQHIQLEHSVDIATPTEPEEEICCNKGCDKRVKRCDLRKHYKICDYKLINCEHADRGCRVILPRVAMPKHIQLEHSVDTATPTEPKEEICCNEGCDKRVKRCDLTQHYKICDYELIECEHADRGCRVILPRVAMPQHIQLRHTATPTEPREESVTAATPTEPREESVTAATPTEPGEESVTAATPTEPGEESVTAATPTEPREESVTAATPTEPREESVTAATPTEPGEESVTAATPTEPREESVTAATPTEPGEESVTAATPTEPRKESVTAATPTEPGEANTTPTKFAVFSFEMSAFQEHKEECDNFISPPFHTSPGGYKMCVRVTPKKNSYLSVTVHLMQGENDDYLPWPLRPAVLRIELLNQLGDYGHYSHPTKELVYDEKKDSDSNKRVRQTERSDTGYGWPEFIRLQAIKKPYLINDTLRFRVTVVQAPTLSHN